MAETDSEGERTVLTVPRFSSFKSKEPLKEPRQAERRHDSPPRKRRTEDESRSQRSSTSGHRKSRHNGNEPHRQRDRRSHSGDRRPHRNDKPRPEKLISNAQNGVPGLFMIDSKGDPFITRYGGIDKSQIPAYYRHGGGKVLGTIGRLVIHRDQARDQFSLRMPGDGPAVFADGDGLRSRRPAIRPHPVIIRARKGGPQESADDGPEDFIPLSSSHGRKRKRSDDSSEDDEHPDYRSIHGKVKPPQEESESDKDSDEPIDITITAQNNPLRWKSRQLSKQVKEHPGDIDAWFELVDHQDALLKAGEDIDHSVLEDEAHSFAEIKVSMLEKALHNTSRPEDRRRVLVYLMREGVKIWTSKTAAKRWAQVLQDENDHFDLWKAHFDFFISNITTFRFEDGKRMLVDRLRRSVSRATAPGEALGEVIYIFLLATRFVHDAGYKELAVAAWQGILEFNLFRPQSITDEKPALEAFQDFWESEVPRIGDPGAKGWKQFVEGGGAGDPPEPEKSETPEPSTSRDMYKAWCHLEQAHAERAQMPARTMDDGTQDDPFRVVMFADIEAFLFLIPGALTTKASEQLLDAFLLFSGAQPAFKSSPWTRAAMRDPLIASSLVEMDMTLKVARPHDDDQTADESVSPTRRPDFEGANVNAAVSPWILFSDPMWFRYLNQRQKARVDTTWMAETLKQITHMVGIEALAPYYLALRSSMEPASLKRTAKALLKRFPTNAHIFNAYALAAFANKEIAVADSVLSSMTHAATLSIKWSRFLLCKSWSWMELCLGHKKTASLRLCSSVEPTLRTAKPDAELSRLTILKSQQALTAEFDELLAVGDMEGASCLAECLVLLSYLTAEGSTEPTSDAQGNISTAMAVVEAISRDFTSRGLSDSAAHEQVLQFAAQLLYFNAANGPFRRAYLRDQLSRFIAQFPQNTIFLSLFEWSDASLRVIDETRDMLYQSPLASPHDCTSSRVFAIRHELSRGNTNTAKSAFEQALASDACRNSPALWIAYIRFCHGQKALRPKAKDVFYRAVRHCPASKGVVMEAFGTLTGEMKGEELRGVFEQMSGKGMRVHVDLEEFLEKRR